MDILMWVAGLVIITWPLLAILALVLDARVKKIRGQRISDQQYWLGVYGNLAREDFESLRLSREDLERAVGAEGAKTLWRGWYPPPVDDPWLAKYAWYVRAARKRSDGP